MRWLRVVVGVGLVAGLGSVMWRHAYGEDQPIPIGSASVVGVNVFPVPEGPSLILSEDGRQGGFPIELVEGLIPDPLPGEMHQGFHCTSGSEITFHLSDGRSVSYGPCRVPSAIHGFQAQMDGAVDDFGSASPSLTSVEAAMLAAARAGDFQKPPPGTSWTFPVDCRVDLPGGFHGADIYLCAISATAQPGVHMWEWGMLRSGALHTHQTDPKLIPTITGPFDPPWLPSASPASG